MNREDIKFIKKKLSLALSEKRYEHSIGVAYTAAALAMRYGEDMYKAELAGLLHDCAKHYSNEELIRLCNQAGEALTESELASPQILHAIYAPYLARKRYGIEDGYILSALRWHTTGKENMSLLDKIIFVADFIEPNRYRHDGLDCIRKLAFEDIDMASYQITESTIQYLSKHNIHIDEMTLKCYNWFRKIKGYD